MAVEFLLGLNRDERRAKMMDKMREACMAGATRVYMLVPEQSTFVMSKEVCRVLGNDVSNGRIEVIGFKQLVEKAFDECGEKTPHMDEGGRILAMRTAVERVRKDLQVYRSSAGRVEFLKDLTEAYTMMMLHGAPYTKLRLAAEEVTSPTLKKKLMDMALIFETYTEICERKALDPAHIIIGAADLIKRKGTWLDNSRWFVDGFNDFPEQQMRLIRAVLERAEYMMFSFAAASEWDERESSRVAAKTIRMLRNEVKERGRVTCVSNESREHPALAALQNWLCETDPITEPFDIDGADKVIGLFSDPTPYMECQHVSGTIMRAVRKEGGSPYRYRDISVVLSDYDRYAPILRAAFSRYGIPAYFASDKEEMVRKPVLLSVISALTAAVRGMAKEDVLQYLKSGMSNLSEEEVDMLESYILTWNIHGRGWMPEGDWTMHPDGAGLELREEDADHLEKINECRRKGIQPLLKLREDMAAGTTVAEYAEALYNFLETVGFTERLQQIVDDLVAEKDEQAAMEYGQVSEVLNNALEQMHATIGHLESSANDFIKMFRLVCSAYKIMTIPVSVDRVEVFSIEDARFTCTKLRYIMGVEEGKFPNHTNASALLDADEIQEINMSGKVNIPGTSEDVTARNMSDIASVITGAKRKLVFSYASDPTAPTQPSHLILRLKQMFPSIETVSGGDKERGGIYDADTMGAEVVGRLMGRLHNRTQADELNLQLCGVDNETMQSTGDRVMSKASWALGGLKADSVKGIYGETLHLSATRANVYASCRYHYFLKYGLKLRELASGKVTSPVFGRFAHQVLEHAMREVEMVYGGFKNVDRPLLEEITRKHIDAYAAEYMSGLETQPERYQYLFRRNCREILSVMRNISDEFNVSDFHSAAFELKVGGEGADMPPVPVYGTKASGYFTGIVDRVDVCELEDGRTYFRVVDYKTGKAKKFDYADILTGAAVQIMLYQEALRRNGFSVSGKEADTAGMLYVHASETVVATNTKVSEEKVAAEHDKARVREGVVSSDRDVLSAMEYVEGDRFRYLPVRFHKDGTVSGSIASAEQMDMLGDFSLLTLGDMVDGVVSGDIHPNPISRGMDRTACKWCKYKDICHKDACGVKYRYQSKVGADAFWGKVSERVSGDAKDAKRRMRHFAHRPTGV